MAHPQQLDYVNHVKGLLPQFFDGKTVLEIGSLDINGSVRAAFSNCTYTGIDVGAGSGVDVVMPGQLADFPSQHFDVTISCECFEHNPHWLETFCNMIRMTKTGGLVIMTCASIGRAEHGTTRTSPDDSPLTVGRGWEYYRNLQQHDFTRRLDLDTLFSSYGFSACKSSKDLYFTGIVRRDDSRNTLGVDLASRLPVHMSGKDRRYQCLTSHAPCLMEMLYTARRRLKVWRKAWRQSLRG